MLDLVPFAVLIPLLGFLHNIFLIRVLPPRFSGTVAVFAVLGPFFILLGAFQEFQSIQRSTPHLIKLYEWFGTGSFTVNIGYQVDELSLYMSLIITGIGSLIHIYSMGYMKGEKGFTRFFAYLNLFIFSMLNLVLSDNLVLTFLGWEGVGLCSYLLIGFDFHKEEAANAGFKAFLVNRIGDLGFIVGASALYWYTGSVQYAQIQAAIPGLSGFVGVADWIALSFFIACMGKSAQIPLYVWLPDAMAGPTPVSALIHAATMVTAGVFLIARLSPVFILAQVTSEFIAWIGVATAFFAATIGLLQTDIKKILAYSTVSQLGFMFLAMGVGAYEAGVFHLMTHAFFKALLFLGAGSVIHALHHEQDVRNMGGLFSKMKITGITFLVGTLAIAGFPPFSGFFSKDYILEEAFLHSGSGIYLWGIGLVSAFFTSFYMFRLVFLTFFGTTRLSPEKFKRVHESPSTITIPLVLLAIGASVAGFLKTPHSMGDITLLIRYFKDVLEPARTLAEKWGGVGFPKLGGESVVHAPISPSLELSLIGASVLVAVLGLVLAYSLYISGKKQPMENYSGLSKLIFHKYYIDELYHSLLVKPLLQFSEFLSAVVDRKIIDRGVVGVGLSLGLLSQGLRRLQTGIVGDYALYIVLGSFGIVALLLSRGF